METFAVDWQVIDGYVWCDMRGDIHSTAYGSRVHELRHGLTEFWDLFDDGVLCNTDDHYPVGARLPEGYEL